MCQQSVPLDAPSAPPIDAPSPLALPLSAARQQFLILILIFGAIAPMLPWLQFTGGMENVSVATAMETARDGHWLVPTLHGQPRVKKPPIAHWLGAMGILSSQLLAWGVRWPTLVCACIFLLSVYHLAGIIGGPQIALASALICGSNFLFLRYARQTSYNIPLARWVGIANVFLAKAVFQQQWWGGLHRRRRRHRAGHPHQRTHSRMALPEDVTGALVIAYERGMLRGISIGDRRCGRIR